MKKYKTLAGLLAKPERWCKSAAARTEDGETTQEDDPRACAFCLWGGVLLIYGNRLHPRCKEMSAHNLIEKATEDVFPNVGKSSPYFNDAAETSHADMLRVARRIDLIMKARAAK